MITDSPITELLQAATAGDESAFEDVVTAVYAELERLAESKLRRQYGHGLAGATLEANALVNETLMKLIRKPSGFENRKHFFAFVNKVMVRVLQDYERRKRAAKREHEAVNITLSGIPESGGELSLELLELFEKLAKEDERKAEVVKLRLLFGLENREIAEVLEVSVPTVERDWRFSRAWIRRQLS